MKSSRRCSTSASRRACWRADPAKAAALLGDDVEIYRGDFSDPPSVDGALVGVDRAFLLTPPTPDIADVQAAFVDAAKRAGVSHVVKLSAVGAGVGVPHRFGDWHGQAERYLGSSGLAWTHLRPNFFLQNLLTLADQIRAGTIYMPAGDGAPMVDVRDIAAVAARVLTEDGHAGQTYDVTGPEAFGYAEIAATFTRVLGRDVQYVDVPPAAARDAMTGGGMPEWLADALNELTAGLKENRFALATDVVERVGRKTPITLEQFVREHAAHFR